MEFLEKMTFMFWTSLIFLLFYASTIYFNFFGINKKIKYTYYFILNNIIPVSEKNRNKKLKLKLSKAAAFISHIVFLVFLIALFFSVAYPYGGGGEENKLTGPLGDLFNGLITPILSFLTFCGLLITIMIQNLQMKATFKELDLTRKEFEKSNISMDKQVSNSESQKIDNYFFSLLEHHKIVLNDLSNERHPDNLSVDIFSHYYRIFAEYEQNMFFYICKWRSDVDRVLPFYLINYNLLSWVDKNVCLKKVGIYEENFEKAKSYTNILRATLKKELLFLIYSNVTIGEFEEYKRLVVKYGLLEHLELSQIKLPIFMDLFSRIDENAFGDKIRLKKYLENHWNTARLSGFLVDRFIVNCKRVEDFPQDRLDLMKDKLHEFIRVKYKFDFLKDNLKLLHESDIDKFLAAKGLDFSDLINYEKFE